MQEAYEKERMVWCFQQQKPETDNREAPAIVILILLDVITPQDLQARIILKVVKISYNL